MIRHGSSAASSTGSTGGPSNSVRFGDEDHAAVRSRRRQLGGVALVAEDERRPCRVEPQPQVSRPQLLGARQHDGADAEAGDHRQHPFGAVADHRHDDVAAADAAARERPRQPRRSVGDLPERPLPPRPVARQLDQGEPRRVGGVDDIAREVHRRKCRGWGGLAPPLAAAWGTGAATRRDATRRRRAARRRQTVSTILPVVRSCSPWRWASAAWASGEGAVDQRSQLPVGDELCDRLEPSRRRARRAATWRRSRARRRRRTPAAGAEQRHQAAAVLERLQRAAHVVAADRVEHHVDACTASAKSLSR